MKRILTILLFIPLVLCAFALTVSAKHQYGTNLMGTNVEAQDYSATASPIYSYIETVDSGNFMTVTAGEDAIEIDYYTPKYALYKSITVDMELPIFGGFYATEDSYYILSGQTNYDEDPGVEVYRVTKYDKNWKRLGAASLYGANTTIPFRAGSARFAHVGDTLVVRTCHRMYKSRDGLNHQANVTFSVNTSNMSIITSWDVVANINWGGYVSHSFNQFIQYDGERLVAVDHGDGYPRSVCMVRYNTSAFLADNVGVNGTYNLLNIPGGIGDNYTGVSVGGFEFSDSTYIVVGNSEIGSANSVRNIFVSTLSRSGGSPKLTYLTNNTAYGDSASTPHLVKLSNDKFMVLWSIEGEVYYTLLNAQGEKTGSIKKFTGSLSDCVPTVVGENVIWYTYNDNDVTFYSIHTKKLTGSKKTINNGHVYTQKSNKNYHWQECSDCGLICGKSAHSNTPDSTYQDINAKGNIVIACKTCKYAFKTKKVTYSVTADGKTPILTTSSGTLQPDVDYGYYAASWSEVYGNNGFVINEVTFCIYGMDIFSENVYKTFRSLPLNASAEDIKAQPYTGKAIKPSVKVVSGGKTLKKDTDYTVTYKNNKKVGTATVIITGKGEYFGTITKTFAIKENIASAKVSGIKNKIYTGEKRQQSLKVEYKGKTLKEGTDYTVTYKNNTKVGTATVKITGKGKYAGTITKTFKIKLSTPKVTIANAAKGVKVSWNKIAGAKTYTVYRSTYSGGKWGKWKAVKTGVTGTSYTDKSVKSGAKVKYMVKAVNGKTTSASKASSTIKFLAQPAVKVAKVSAGIKATWKKITGAKGYVVYRRTYSNGKWGKWVKVKTTTALNYTDKTAKKGVYYQYKVCAYYGDYKSTYTTTSKIKR